MKGLTNFTIAASIVLFIVAILAVLLILNSRGSGTQIVIVSDKTQINAHDGQSEIFHIDVKNEGPLHEDVTLTFEAGSGIRIIDHGTQRDVIPLVIPLDSGANVGRDYEVLATLVSKDTERKTTIRITASSVTFSYTRDIQLTVTP